MTLLEALYIEITQYLQAECVNNIAPYHNYDHMVSVWEIAQKLWAAEKTLPHFVHFEPEEVSLAKLMVGTLFHDVHHCGGRLTDRENIRLAIREIKLFVLVKSKVLNDLFSRTYPKEMGGILYGAIGIVDCTEFPFIKEPATTLERIMRDADVLYAVNTKDPKVIMEHLRTEIETARQHQVTYEDMLQGQLKFMASVKFYTAAGQAMWDELAEPYMRQLKAYAPRPLIPA
jgi:hypothetical protein